MLDDINDLIIAIQHNGVHFLLCQLADRGDKVTHVPHIVQGVGACPDRSRFNVLNQNPLVLDDLLPPFVTR